MLLVELRARQGSKVPSAAIMPVQVADYLESLAAKSAFEGFVGVSEVRGLPEVGWSLVVLF